MGLNVHIQKTDIINNNAQTIVFDIIIQII